jgi:uncharacterized GH25 family protein
MRTPGFASCLRRTAVLLAMLAVSEASAHDFWIEPSTYRPSVPSSVAVRLFVGDHFGRGEAYPRNPAHLRSFVIAGPAGTAAISGRAGEDPAGTVRIDAPGIYVIGYRSNHTVTELAADRFEAYLREENFEHISRQRAEHAQSSAPGREAFSRCAKAILVAGDGDGAGYDRGLGFTLELIPEKDPAALRPGDELPLRLLHEGAPLSGAYVAAINAEDASKRVEGRTNSQRRVSLRLGRDGVWLVRSVHMLPAAAGLDADWESLWASLTFLVTAPR